MKRWTYIFTCVAALVCILCARSAHATTFLQDSTIKQGPPVKYEPSTSPSYRHDYRFGDPYADPDSKSPFLLEDPSSIQEEVEFDSSINYSVYERIGDYNFRPPTWMSFEEYDRYHDNVMIRNYWHEQSVGLDGESAVSGRRLIPRLYISPIFDRIFGGSYVDIRPTGFVNLDFGGLFQYIDNPQVPERQRRNGGFNFNMQISSNVVGKIGEKLQVTFNFDNNNSFDFQNDMKIEYTGFEEDIIKKIELGNVSMPVSNSLITGGQALFGVKTQLQFGKLYVTGIASRQQGRSEVLTIENGANERQFELRASTYDENRHYFLGHFFRDNYEAWLSGLPQVISGVNITRVEVYVMNRNNNTDDTRNFVSFLDLGEGNPTNIHNPGVLGNGSGPTNNGANSLYSRLTANDQIRVPQEANGILESQFGMTESTDFVKITTARQLSLSEFTVHPQLGYVSLVRKLNNDEVLAVAYEYTYNGQTYKVGELTEDYQRLTDEQLIYLKMLRPNKIDTRIPSWDLMMKNVYNLNSGQVQRDGFTLRIQYRDDRTGIDNPSLHEGRLTKDIPLIELLGLDQLNRNNDRQRDGNFDYIEGITIDSRNGLVIFPVLEPFGPTLQSYFDPADERYLIEKYVYDTLYRTTRAEAELDASRNKYFIVGKFAGGSASEIVLPGINVSPGSVVVTAGGTPLTEGLDYSVDYNLGRVRILNQGIMSSGKTIQISYEKADIFNFQTRWLTGANFDYVFNDNFTIGATILNINERPGAKTRYAIGDEPTRNTKYGFNMSYQDDVPFLTKMVDFLPLINTKERSTVTFNGEFAQLIPGTSNIVQGEGTSYIDDFENAITIAAPLQGWQGWNLASTPETPDGRFDRSTEAGNNLGVNYRRAKLAWYTVDNSVFYIPTGGRRPANINESDLENHYEKQVLPQDIYPQKDRTLVTTNEKVLDLAYFPHERGPYNYNPNLDQNGLLPDPTENWAGITHHIRTEVDFDKSNIEYLEFWLLDPFIGYLDGNPRGRVLDGLFNDNNRSGGDLIFNLGSVSEDFMKDGRHAFENGLPADGDLGQATANEWGYVTNQQFLINQFENSQAIRTNQDVGMDGLKSEQEPDYFQSFLNNLNVSAVAAERINADVSADNFRYYLGNDLDNANAKIVQRYKNYNGHEGNSPATADQFTEGSTTIPDNEDISQDNTVATLEEYYEYHVPLRPGQLETGRGYIVDQVIDRSGEGTWYLFRIPVKRPDKIVGNIDGFKSMQYVRMYLTGFRQPVVLRMSNFRLVGSQWRKYEGNLQEVGFDEVPEITNSDFQLSVVNIEENSIGNDNSPPYVIPPGLDRDRDNTTFLNRRDNEQSLQLCVEDLEDKDAKAVYKNVGYDLINYGRLKMFFHAHADQFAVVRDNEVAAFLRFGTDYAENYYEIEIPLIITPRDLTGASEDELRRLVWPLENELDLSINELLGLKSARNRNDIDIQIPYSEISENGKYKLTVKGRPDISSILTMMIGIRNLESVDNRPLSVCLWANELRVTDFDTHSGWAANARLSTKLADLATVNASTRYSTIGFGSIQQRISERQREDIFRYDVSANVNVDRFLLPQKTGLKVPMFVSYEQTKSTPQFDPLDPDIPLEASLERLKTDEEKEEYLALVEDRTTRRSLNFTNVRKDKVKSEAKNHVYDIENLSFTYAFSDQVTTSVNMQEYYRKTQRGGVSYNYSPKGLTVEPFSKVEALNSPWFKLIQDINFSFLPTNLNARADLNRSFIKTQLYNDRLTIDGIEPYYERLFTFSRNYGFRWNLFRGLSLDYAANANAVIDEPDDMIEGDITTKAEREFIWQQIVGLGRMKTFNQTVAANYKLPLDKFPLTDWLSADYRYSAGYNWTAGSLNQNDTLGNFFGNTAANNRSQTATGKIDMVKLYNKVTFLKAANTPARSNRSTAQNTEAPSSSGGFGNSLLRVLMSVRNINATYTVRESTSLPGFTPVPKWFGMDSVWDAPGLPFLLGSQDPGIRFEAAENGWLTQSPMLTAPFQQQLTRDITFRAAVEPSNDLKIQLDAKRSTTGGYQEIYRYDMDQMDYRSLTPSRNGRYSISFISINTAFEKQEDNQSPAFERFVDNIDIVYNRMNEQLLGSGISDRYDTISQDVLVPAFLAAYGNGDPNAITLRPFPTIPLPNWRVDYAGLSKIPVFAEIFSSINLTHAYNSTFNIQNYTNSLLYQDNMSLDNDIVDYPLGSVVDSVSGNLVPVFIINQVGVAEQFAPLFGINVRTKSNLNARLDFKKSRSLSLNLSNAQVTETSNEDVSFDFGYTKSDLRLPWRVRGRVVTIENDVTFRVNMTIRDSKTTQRKIDGENTLTNGNKNFQVRPSIGYKLNDQLDLTMYFERSITNPTVGSFRRATTSFGVQLRFSLNQ